MQSDQPVVVGFRSETPTEGNSNRGNRETCGSRVLGMVVTTGWVSTPVLYPEHTEKRSHLLVQLRHVAAKMASRLLVRARSTE